MNSEIEGIKSPRVAIAGYIGYGNLGDEAMLDAVIHLLKRNGIEEISVFSAGDFPRQSEHGVHYAPELPGKLLDLVKACLRGELLPVLGSLSDSQVLFVAGAPFLQERTFDCCTPGCSGSFWQSSTDAGLFYWVWEPAT